MQLSTYLKTEQPQPCKYWALVVYAADKREAAPLIARITGQEVADMVRVLSYLGEDRENTATTVPRRASYAEIVAAGKPYTKRLLHRVASPKQTFPCALAVARSFHPQAAVWVKTRLTGAECGVLVIEGKAPANAITLYDEGTDLQFTVLEVPNAH